MMAAILLYFNSIKVRLKLNPNETFKIGYKFQFHKGTIKTQSVHSNRPTYFISIP